MPIVTGIVWTHRFNASPSWFSDEHAKERHYDGIVYLLEGEAKYCFIDGRNIVLSAGDCIYLPRETPYTIRCSPNLPFVHMTVNFNLAEQNFLGNKITKKHLSNGIKFEQVFGRMIHIWAVRHHFYEERCIGFLYELLYLLENEVCTNASPYLNKIAPARQYLDEHFTEEVSPDALSRLCGMSPSYLRRLFRQALGETPSEYKRRLRMAMAKDLLLGSQMTVSQVAVLCGYEDLAYFSRVFRKTTGVSPSRFCEMPRDI